MELQGMRSQRGSPIVPWGCSSCSATVRVVIVTLVSWVPWDTGFGVEPSVPSGSIFGQGKGRKQPWEERTRTRSQPDGELWSWDDPLASSCIVERGLGHCSPPPYIHRSLDGAALQRGCDLGPGCSHQVWAIPAEADTQGN